MQNNDGNIVEESANIVAESVRIVANSGIIVAESDNIDAESIKECPGTGNPEGGKRLPSFSI